MEHVGNISDRYIDNKMRNCQKLALLEDYINRKIKESIDK